jgi:HAD superfamily hydrolase (TIGR01490 family)
VTPGPGTPPVTPGPAEPAAGGDLPHAAPPAPVPPEAAQNGAAFFDLDRTLMAGSSAFQWARASYQAGLITRRQIASDAWANIRFRLQGSTDEGTEELRVRVAKAIEGVRVRDLQRLAPRVLEGVLPRLYPQMLEVAYAHQDAGRPVYICTAAGQEIAEMLAYVCAFDGGIGSVSEIEDGVYTGRPGGLFTYREGKAEAIRLLAEERGIDLAASYAYSDSESDLPMLDLVGHAVVVNPDHALEGIARERGWEVMRFERLGRRLKVALAAGAAATAAAAVGGSGVRIRRAAPRRGATGPLRRGRRR